MSTAIMYYSTPTVMVSGASGPMYQFFQPQRSPRGNHDLGTISPGHTYVSEHISGEELTVVAAEKEGEQQREAQLLLTFHATDNVMLADGSTWAGSPAGVIEPFFVKPWSL